MRRVGFTILCVFLASWKFVFVLSTPIQKISSTYKVSARAFEPWAATGNDKRFNLSEFTGNALIHPFEVAHLYDGDVMGVGGHATVDEDGQRHFHISIWPDGVVPYIITGHFKQEDLKRIQNAFNEYHQRTCIRFVPKEKEDKLYINIQSNNTGCWSYIGQLGRPQEINLASPGCMSHSTIIHELMHAIGFIHEQSRPDRDLFIKLHLENLKSKKHARNFDIKPDLYENVGVPYDIGSVMQYDETSFSKNDRLKTMVAKNGKKLGNNRGFALSDIKEINRLYHCEGLQN